jgi:hypothetical protein
MRAALLGRRVGVQHRGRPLALLGSSLSSSASASASASAGDRHVLFEESATVPGLGILTLHRPLARNALSEEMGESIIATCAELNERPPSDIRSLLIVGAGKAFSAGRDLKLSKLHTTAPQRSKYMRLALDSVLAIAGLKMPTVACIHGAAFGWGLEICLACDVRVSFKEATLCLPEASLGKLHYWNPLSSEREISTRLFLTRPIHQAFFQELAGQSYSPALWGPPSPRSLFTQAVALAGRRPASLEL